jgi:hypothetical protein
VKVAKTRERLEEAVDEHLSVKRLLADMMMLEVEDASFAAKLKVLKEQLEHHAHKEEEAKLFPEVKTLLSGEQLEALGGEMLALYEELLEGEPRRQIPSEISGGLPCGTAGECPQDFVCAADRRCYPDRGCAAGSAFIGGSCTDVDECTAETDDCDINASCANTSDGFTCTCNDGYFGTGQVCDDINECEEDTDDCGPLASCTLDG